MLAPEARADDGVWDLVLGRTMPRWRLLASWQATRTREALERSTRLEHHRVKSLRIERVDAPDSAINVDGELRHHLPCDVRVVAGGLRVIL